jgi:hypothetical protein
MYNAGDDMKNLREYATFKNLNTATTTVIDDEGNIEELEDGESSGESSGEYDDDYGDWFSLDADTSEFEGEDTTSSLFGDSTNAPLPGMEGEEESGLEGEDEEGPFSLDSEAGGAMEGDPDFQGVIRTVTGACLVYKRKTEDGSFEELWVYNVGKSMRTEVKIRRSIMAGTDIPMQDISSQDGAQTAETTTVGNVQFLKLSGLPN